LADKIEKNFILRGPTVLDHKKFTFFKDFVEKNPSAKIQVDCIKQEMRKQAEFCIKAGDVPCMICELPDSNQDDYEFFNFILEAYIFGSKYLSVFVTFFENGIVWNLGMGPDLTHRFPWQKMMAHITENVFTKENTDNYFFTGDKEKFLQIFYSVVTDYLNNFTLESLKQGAPFGAS
jgi:hypothetical protein